MIRKIELNGKPLVGATVTTRGTDDRVLRTYVTQTDGSITDEITGREHACVIEHPDLTLRLTFGHFVQVNFKPTCAHKIGRAYVCNLTESHDFHQRGSSVYRHDFV